MPSLSIKQKLSTLSLGSSRFRTPQPALGDHENDKIDEVMRKVICQAGVDYECAFPTLDILDLVPIHQAKYQSRRTRPM